MLEEVKHPHHHLFVRGCIYRRSLPEYPDPRQLLMQNPNPPVTPSYLPHPSIRFLITILRMCSFYFHLNHPIPLSWNQEWHLFQPMIHNRRAFRSLPYLFFHLNRLEYFFPLCQNQYHQFFHLNLFLLR